MVFLFTPIRTALVSVCDLSISDQCSWDRVCPRLDSFVTGKPSESWISLGDRYRVHYTAQSLEQRRNFKKDSMNKLWYNRSMMIYSYTGVLDSPTASSWVHEPGIHVSKIPEMPWWEWWILYIYFIVISNFNTQVHFSIQLLIILDMCCGAVFSEFNMRITFFFYNHIDILRRVKYILWQRLPNIFHTQVYLQ